MTVLIAIPGTPADRVDDYWAHTEVPALPRLTRLLRRAAECAPSADWRAGVLASLGAAQEYTAPAAMAARAVPTLEQGEPVCFAAPLHLQAGISRMHLPPGGRLLLDEGEERAWRVAFNAEFGPEGVQLHAAAPGGAWLLAAPFADGAQDEAPELLVGEALARAPAAGEAQRALRRLGAEVEMWLAAHGLNREREARHAPVLSAIWFWGGTRVAALPPLDRVGGILAGGAPDAWLAGLAACAGVSTTFATDWNAASRAVTAARQDHILIVPAPAAGEPAAQYWQGLEDQWFAPLAAALETGEVEGVRLQIGGRAWRVQRNSAWQWLRWRRRSWWQMSGQHS